MNIRLSFILLLFICSTAFAEPVVKYSGTTYIDCDSIGDARVWLNDTGDVSSVKAGYLYVLDGCDSLPGVPKYRKIRNGAVAEMSQAEKNAVDQAEVDVIVTTKANRRAQLDALIESSQISDFSMGKVDIAIDSMNNLNDAKLFLKRLVRAIVVLTENQR